LDVDDDGADGVEEEGEEEKDAGPAAVGPWGEVKNKTLVRLLLLPVLLLLLLLLARTTTRRRRASSTRRRWVDVAAAGALIIIRVVPWLDKAARGASVDHDRRQAHPCVL